MQSEAPKVIGKCEGRFGSTIFLLRLAGIPFMMKNKSVIYTLYMRTVVFCSCITTLGTYADVYARRDDLGHLITNIRLLIPVMNDIWIYFYCRYVTTQAVTVPTSQVSVLQRWN
jgi:hypothetical protein